MIDRKSDKRRASLIDAMLKTSIKQYGEGATVLLSSDRVGSIVQRAIPSGCPELDKVLAIDVHGVAGWPAGRIIGISGMEASGKTTMCIEAMKSAQRMGGIARMIETEHAFDPSYALKLGLDLDELLISQPDYLEQGLDMINQDCESFKQAKAEHINETGEDWNVPMIIIFDSIAGAPPKAEWEAESYEENQALGLHARTLSKFFRKISKTISTEQICLICTNQLKTDTGVRYGDKSTEIGGKALKFHASIRLDVRRESFIKEGPKETANIIGINTRAKTVKNKTSPPYKTVTIPIIFGKGIDYTLSLFDGLVNANIIKRVKNTYTLEYETKKGSKVINGGRKPFMEKFEERLLKESFKNKMMELLNEK